MLSGTSREDPRIGLAQGAARGSSRLASLLVFLDTRGAVATKAPPGSAPG